MPHPAPNATDPARLHLDLGHALMRRGEARDAAAAYVQALVLRPDFAEAYLHLGNVFLAAEDPAQAEAMYRRALALNPKIDAHLQLGHALRQQGKLAEALRAYDQAPQNADAHDSAARILRETGRLEAALLRFRRAQTVDPHHPRAGFGEALVQLLQGDFTNGWRNYERRWTSIDHGTPYRSYPQPQWRGESLPTGSLFLWPEQGVGDEIMFASLLPDVIKTGVSTILACDPRLQPLFQRSFSTIQVIPDSTTATPPQKTAAHLPTATLPAIFRVDSASFASTPSPYLIPEPILRTQLRASYQTSERPLLVGIAWHTNNQRTGRDRSISLATLAPLFEIPSIHWVSLQYGTHDTLEREAAEASAPIFVDPCIDQFADIDAFAAQVAAMDLVITIDNTTAHLAGALGVPTWLALPFAPDWRWATRANRSLWYPSLRLLRQSLPRDWNSVIGQLHQALILGRSSHHQPINPHPSRIPGEDPVTS